MCGRFVASSPVDLLVDLFDVDEVRLDDDAPSWNVAPTDAVRAVVERDGVRTLESRRWGLVPHWAASEADASKRINARAETIHETPAFRDAFARRRCLIPADGFYEWSSGKPYLVRPRDGGVIAFAAVRATFESRRSCAIVTTGASRSLASLHDRMPVILEKGDWAAWLSANGDPGLLRSLMVSARDDLLEIVRVAASVNSVRNNGPWLVERVDDPVQDSLPL